MTIATIQTKLARAQSDYKDALATLDQFREIYKVSGGAYAAAKARQELLESKIANADTDIENANKLIQSQLEKNHFVKTEAVRSALFEKSEAETIKAELQRVHAEGELPTLKLRITASHDAKAVDDAFNLAHESYARVQSYEALGSDAGRQLSRSMALMSRVADNPGIENLAVDAEELMARRLAFFWKELMEMARECKEFAQRPHIIEIGMLDLGPFSDRKFVTPAEASMLRKAMENRPPVG